MSGQRSSHPLAVAFVLVAAALVGTVTIGSIWANSQLLNTGSWVGISGRMLDSQEVRHRVAEFLSEELVAETEGQLAAAGKGEVAAEVVPQLRRQAPLLAERALESAPFRIVWRRANQEAHRQLVTVLDGDGPTRGEGGGVTVDLTPALRELASSLDETPLASELGEDLGSFVEPGAARIEVLEADELEQAQDVVRVIRHVPVPATIAVAALFALALFLGRAQPRRTLAAVGLSLAAAGALALLARDLAGHRVVDRLLDGDADRAAAEAAWGIATSTVTHLATGAIVLGGITAICALLLEWRASFPADGPGTSVSAPSPVARR